MTLSESNKRTLVVQVLHGSPKWDECEGRTYHMVNVPTNILQLRGKTKMMVLLQQLVNHEKSDDDHNQYYVVDYTDDYTDYPFLHELSTAALMAMDAAMT